MHRVNGASSDESHGSSDHLDRVLPSQRRSGLDEVLVAANGQFSVYTLSACLLQFHSINEGCLQMTRELTC